MGRGRIDKIVEDPIKRIFGVSNCEHKKLGHKFSKLFPRIFFIVFI